jgi:excisionase family DNA binding protein
MHPDELLTVQQVAEMLQMNQQTVYNWINNGDLPFVQAGPRRIRIRHSDLDSFLETRKRERTARLGVMVGPFPSGEAAARWRDEHDLGDNTAAIHGTVVPFRRR